MYNKFMLVQYLQDKIGYPYLYGFKQNHKWDKICTKEDFKKLKKMYPLEVWDSDLKKCVGKKPCDCSGLISAFTEVQKNSLQYYKESNNLTLNYNNLLKCGIGSLVYTKGHIGVVTQIGKSLDDSYYIAEDGSAFGCRKAKLSNGVFNTLLINSHFDEQLFLIQVLKKRKCYKFTENKIKYYKKIDKKFYPIKNIITINKKKYAVTFKNNLIRLNKKGYIIHYD